MHSLRVGINVVAGWSDDIGFISSGHVDDDPQVEHIGSSHHFDYGLDICLE